MPKIIPRSSMGGGTGPIDASGTRSQTWTVDTDATGVATSSGLILNGRVASADQHTTFTSNGKDLAITPSLAGGTWSVTNFTALQLLGGMALSVSGLATLSGGARIDTGVDATGDLLARGAGGSLQAIAAGTNKYVLTSNGPGALPTYQEAESPDITDPVAAAAQGALNVTRAANNYTAGVTGALLTTTVDPLWTPPATVPVGTRILLPSQTSNVDNGVVRVTGSGGIGVAATFVRDADMDASDDLTALMLVPVSLGTDANRRYQLSAVGPFTINVTGLPFTLAGGPPTGPAGGSLAGTYPNPTLAATNSDSVTWSGTHAFNSHAVTFGVSVLASVVDTATAVAMAIGATATSLTLVASGILVNVLGDLKFGATAVLRHATRGRRVPELVSMLNGEVDDLLAGEVVYISGTNTVSRSKGNAAGTAKMYGVVYATFATGTEGLIVRDGTAVIPAARQEGSWLVGDQIWVSYLTAGKLTRDAITSGNIQVITGWVTEISGGIAYLDMNRGDFARLIP